MAEPGRWRVGVGGYRWGLGRDLTPGETVTVVGQLRLERGVLGTELVPITVEEPQGIREWWGRAMPLAAHRPGGSAAVPPERVVVAVRQANVRAGPSIATMVTEVLPQGTELEVAQRSADWLEVVLPDGRMGWVFMHWVEGPHQ